MPGTVTGTEGNKEAFDTVPGPQNELHFIWKTIEEGVTDSTMKWVQTQSAVEDTEGHPRPDCPNSQVKT